MDLADHTALDLRRSVEAGELTALEIADSALERYRRWEPAISAFLHLDESEVRRQAEAVDEKKRGGKPLGALAGIPIAIKDNLCTQNTPTTAASRMLAGFRPPYDAHVVARIREADGILFGKTNLDEFSMGSSCENSAFQTTRNPWDLSRVPGGSSGGSAAAVAASIVPLALGSDTGGSIRQPAALCGITGLKPTYGRVSRRGLIAFASSLDQIGPLSRSATDASLLLSVIAGKDPRDGTSAPRPVDPPLSLERNPQSPLKGLKIGIAEEYIDPTLPQPILAVVEEAKETLVSLGATVVSVGVPHTEYAVPTYYLVANSEASSNLARYDGMHFGHRTEERCSSLAETYARSRSEGFGPEVKRRVVLGTYALSAGYYDAYYLKALKVRAKIRDDFTNAFEQVDLILGPTSPVTAFKIGEKIGDPLSMYLNDILTASASLAGLPAISIPGGFSDDLPVGLQIIGRPFEESRVLEAAAAFQFVTDHHRRRPELGRNPRNAP